MAALQAHRTHAGVLQQGLTWVCALALPMEGTSFNMHLDCDVTYLRSIDGLRPTLGAGDVAELYQRPSCSWFGATAARRQRALDAGAWEARLAATDQQLISWGLSVPF